MTLPVLYSFRRCPYAIRARMAISAAGCQTELREVVLRDKPAAMLAASPKGTVPVLVLPDGRIIDESLDVMRWALDQNDPHGWLQTGKASIGGEALIDWCDGEFKHHLDRYKYATRYEGVDPKVHQAEARQFLTHLESCLSQHQYLASDHLSLSDIAVFPFIRQYVNADKAWNSDMAQPRLSAWLDCLLNSGIFLQVMHKYSQWREGDAPVWFPGDQAA